ncbi:glutamyl-tRNA reductase [Nakamurella lactea]|jgi:glutamyl-tRNA reductase|uniref:glutamyl-tRNA reductase n=1 Tax=Nakamurella lactea TaxID=459515 RepID=UPI00040B6C18|nr:glutamyl-tRNA reductase [Nakamurella lactea]
MLMVLGAGHREVGLGFLENLSSGADRLRALLAGATRDPNPAIAGSVVLSTCNRLEIYLDAVRFHDAVDAVTDAVVRANGMADEDAESALQVRVGSSVGAHLFAVAAGLDAMVVGEAEIAGQVARAHRQAEADGTVTPQLHSLFRAAARTAKSVAGTTRLGDEGRSVATVALDIAGERLGELAGRRALIVGTGAYARVVAAALRARGCTDLRVYSPSGRAAAFARTHDAVAVTAAELPAVLAEADLLVAASGHGDTVDPARVSAALAGRQNPLLVVDLALQRDIPESVRALPTVEVIDLNSVSETAGPALGGESQAAQQIVLDGVTRFEHELAERELDPAVVALRSHVFAVVNTEVEKLRRKYDGDVAEDVAKAMHRVTSSLLHTPTMRAKELAKDGSGDDYLKALHTLFGIQIPPH